MPQGWKTLGAVAPTALVDARLQAHHAVQWVTRLARANLPSQPDDSHTNLGWSRRRRALESHRLAGRDGTSVIAGLRLDRMRLFVANETTLLAECALDGRSDAAAGAWIDRMADARGLRPASGVPLPYALPHHPIADGAAYSWTIAPANFAELARWFDAAADILEETRGELAATTPGPSPVRCWPHHFDTATLLSLGTGDAETAASVGIGMSPGDDFYALPYFYVSPWPAPSVEALPRLAPPGHWHTQGFVGAVATGDRIVAMVKRRNTVRRFLDAAVEISRRLVAR
jgi:hypothetical protein